VRGEGAILYVYIYYVYVTHVRGRGKTVGKTVGKEAKKVVKISDKKRGANSVVSAPNLKLVKAHHTTVAPQD